jgi:hypothetical protein
VEGAALSLLVREVSQRWCTLWWGDAGRQEATMTSSWRRWKTSPGCVGWPAGLSRVEGRWAGWLGLTDRPRSGEGSRRLSWSGG